MNFPDSKGWTRKVKKLKGAYGETDFEKKTITINKVRHKASGVSRVKKNKDGSESLLNTIVHEEMHKAHPDMTEKVIRKKALIKAERMGKKSRNKLYKKYKGRK